MIKKDTVVTFNYLVTDTSGKLLEKGDAPAVYLHGGYGNVPQHLEQALEGRRAGERVTVQVEPAQGFGERDETLVRHEPRSKFPAGKLEVGMRVEGQREDTHEPMTFTITALDDFGVTLDANHPMAGITMVFDVEIVETRPATAEEIRHGHVHGPGGHHH